MRHPYRDRTEAGQVLAAALADLADDPQATVLALPRGGAPVAAEIAAALSLPLDVLVVRKLGVPGREELAMGAIASGGARVLNDDLVRQLNIATDTLEQVAERERRELERREQLFRGTAEPPQIQDRSVILVDDGIATGATVRAAVRMLRQLGARRVILAVPVAPPEVVEQLATVADRVVCPNTPEGFRAVGQWYRDFEQVSDDQVRRVLAEQERRRPQRARSAGESAKSVKGGDYG